MNNEKNKTENGRACGQSTASCCALKSLEVQDIIRFFLAAISRVATFIFLTLAVTSCMAHAAQRIINVDFEETEWNEFFCERRYAPYDVQYERFMTEYTRTNDAHSGNYALTHNIHSDIYGNLGYPNYAHGNTDGVAFKDYFNDTKNMYISFWLKVPTTSAFTGNPKLMYIGHSGRDNQFVSALTYCGGGSWRWTMHTMHPCEYTRNKGFSSVDIQDDQYHHLEIFYDCSQQDDGCTYTCSNETNCTSTNNPGIARISIDGVIQYESNDVVFKKINSDGHPAITRIQLTGNASSTESEARVLLGDIEVWDGLPNEGPDVTEPTLSTVTAVPTPAEDTTPSFTFSSTEAGTIAYGGGCSSATTTANSGNNTITFNALAVGTYSDCTITVTDAAANASTPLAVGTFVIEAPAAVAGTYYASSSIGDDNNDGRSEATPWKTLSKVNSSTFVSRDTILLRKGDTWRESLIPPTSGTTGQNITFDAYGVGDAPLILGSDSYSATTDWTDDGANIWYADNVAIPTLLIMFGPESPTNVGEPKPTKAEVVALRDYWHDPDTDRIYTYATSNPATVFGTIEIPVRKFPVQISDKQYIAVRNLHIKYGATYSIRIDLHSNHCLIDGNTIDYNGGTWQITSLDPLRGRGGGNAINITDAASYLTVSNNTIDQCYDYGIGIHNYDRTANAAWPDMVMEHNIISNNTISNCSGGMSLTSVSTKDTTTIRHNLVHGNTVSDLGYGWSGYERPGINLRDQGLGAHGDGLVSMEATGSVLDDNSFYDNTFTHFAGSGMKFDRASTNVHVARNKITGGTGEGPLTLKAGLLISNGASVDAHHNIITDMDIRGFAYINQNKGQPESTLYNNTFYNVGASNAQAGADVYNGDNLTFKNNIVQTLDKTVVRTVNDTNVVFNNNLYWRVGGTIVARDSDGTYRTLPPWQATGQDANSLYENPLFTSSTDFHLQAGSPAIDACDNAVWQGTPNVTDFAGTPITDAAGNVIGTMDCGALSAVETPSVWTPLPLATSAQKAAGIPGGEGGQTIFDMKIAPTDPNRIYAATDTSRIWVSTDGGTTWKNKPTGFRTKGALSLAVSPSNPDIVIAAGSVQNTNHTSHSADGIYRTTDGGDNWTLVHQTAFIRDYGGQDNILFVDDNTVYAGTNTEGLLKSTDAGATWTALNILTDRQIEQVHKGNNKIYLGTNNGLYTLVNDVTLSSIGSGLPGTDIIALAVDPTNDLNVYAVVDRTVYKSTDGGANFALSDTGITQGTAPRGVKRIEVSPVDPTHIYCAVESHVYKSTDSGATWTSTPVIDPEGYMADLSQTNQNFAFTSSPVICLSNVDENIILSSGAGHYVLKSTDAGATYHYSASGFMGLAVNSRASSFIWDKGNALHYALAVTDFGVMQTFDGGQSFSNTHVPRINNHLTASVGVFDPDDSTRIIAAVGSWTEKQIVVSTDGGATWAAKVATNGVNSHGFAAYNPQHSNEVYLGKWFSADDGDTWTERTHIIRAMFPGNGDIVYGATLSGTDMTIYKSVDKGVTWTTPYPVFNYGSTTIREMAIDPNDENRIYLASDTRGLWIYNGTAWEAKGEADGITKDSFNRYGIINVVIDLTDNNTIYIGKNSSIFGHSNGIFKSTDKGNSWTNITAELGPDLNVISVGVRPTSGEVYIGTMGGNYFIKTDLCKDQTTLTGLTSCLKEHMPASASEGFVIPTAQNLTDFRAMSTAALAGTCNDTIVPAGLSDIYTVWPMGKYCVVSEKQMANGWGALIINTTPARQMSIQVAHPLYDTNTLEQSTSVFEAIEAHTLVIAGAHRNANAAEGCQAGYKISDVAHNINNFPHVVTEDIISNTEDTVIQFHGMGGGTCAGVDAYITHGSSATPAATDVALKIRDEFRLLDGAVTVNTPGDTPTCSLNATNNTAGRFINGSADVCNTAATTYNGRFIHIDQKIALRNSGQFANWANAIINATTINKTFGPLPMVRN